jgi:malate dehydrogenase
MERRDLLEANGGIFKPQGAALNEVAASDVRVLVVGNPANTNALIAASHAPDVPRDRFTAMMRLDHNRAVSQLAKKAGVPVLEISNVTVWGKHSTTQYPAGHHARIGGKPAADVINDQSWIEKEFIPTVAKRGASVIAARGASSAASAANAAINHVFDWVNGTAEGDWVSVGLVSDGAYGIPEGLVAGFPAVSRGSRWQVVTGLDLNEFARSRIDTSVAELVEERDAVKALGFI